MNWPSGPVIARVSSQASSGYLAPLGVLMPEASALPAHFLGPEGVGTTSQRNFALKSRESHQLPRYPMAVLPVSRPTGKSAGCVGLTVILYLKIRSLIHWNA